VTSQKKSSIKPYLIEDKGEKPEGEVAREV